MKPQFWQIVRFGLVGLVNTGTFYVLYRALLPLFPHYYPVAYAIAFVLSMIPSFFMNTYFTYRTKPTWRKFLLFPLPNITNLVVQLGAVYALVQWLHLDKRIAPLPAMALAIPLTFVLSKLVLTGRPSARVDDLRPAAVEVEVVDQ